jgi:hypothetical protein
MTQIDYANQIANLIKELAPYSNLTIGDKFQATNIEISGGKVFLEFSEENYDYLKSLITDVTNPNLLFTISGFHLKNNIKSFFAYPDSSLFKYAFLVEFEKPHKFSKDQTITVKGFTNTSYNIEYKVIKIIDSFFAVLFPKSTVSIVDVTTGLGYIPSFYTTGMNGIKTLSDEGLNTLSYQYDIDDYFSVLDIDDVDQDYDIFLHYYNDSVKVIDLQTFITNFTDSKTFEYLIVDTSSLAGTQKRSRSNNQDNSYNSYGRIGYFEKNYSLTIHYILERNQDDSNNQTSSGSDIIKKQVEMHDCLLSILREPLEDELNNKIFTSLTISSDGPPITISEGRIRIPYELSFSVFYNNDILIKKEESGYKINSLKINNDTVDFS